MSSLEFRITHYANKRYKSLGSHNVDPEIYTVPKGKVTIYVDRKKKKIVLYYNNRKITEVNGALSPPKGSGIVFHTLQRTGEAVTISDIKVSTWNGDVIENSEKDAERLKTNDIITDTTGNPMPGKLSGITKKNGQFFVDFNIAFAKKSSSIPMKAIHHIDFQRPANKEVIKKSTKTVTTAQGGLFSYKSSQIIGDNIIIDHPIIGKIKINTNTLNRIEVKEIK